MEFIAMPTSGPPAERVRFTDQISLGGICQAIPRKTVDEVLVKTGRTSVRQRRLPADVMMYYVIAMVLFMDDSCREVLRWLMEGLKRLFPEIRIRVAGKSGITQARERLGVEPLKQLYEQLVQPIAEPEHSFGLPVLSRMEPM